MRMGEYSVEMVSRKETTQMSTDQEEVTGIGDDAGSVNQAAFDPAHLCENTQSVKSTV